jgi:hypothetical protein
MTIEQIANATIEPATFEDIDLKGDDYQVGDLIKDTLRVYQQRNGQVKEFAPYLQGATVKDTCRNIWEFIRRNIEYRRDPIGDQYIQRPSRLWASKVGDCKSYSIFTASVLHQLGINAVFRFVGFEPAKILSNGQKVEVPSHVYIVVPNKGREIVIDCVPEIKFFGQQAAYTHKKDYSMGRLKELAGIGDAPALSPDTRQVLYLMRALVEERQHEADNNGGWISEDRDILYQNAFAALQQKLSQIASLGDITPAAVAEIAAWTGIPGASLFAGVLSNILGGKPNPEDYKGWKTAWDAKHWTINDGDSVQNEAINIIGYINAKGIQYMLQDLDGSGPGVTIRQIYDKLVRGGFQQQAQALLTAPVGTNTTGVITNSVNDITKKPVVAGNNNTFILLAVAGAAAYMLLKK